VFAYGLLFPEAISAGEADGAEDDEDEEYNRCSYEDLDLHVLPPHAITQVTPLPPELVSLVLQVLCLVDDDLDTLATLEHLHGNKDCACVRACGQGFLHASILVFGVEGCSCKAVGCCSFDIRRVGWRVRHAEALRKE
jgi:hypothetical protein